MRKPSDFKGYPWGSVFQNPQSETVAQHILTILGRTGDTWRRLTWEEYKEERLKDHMFTESEKFHFDRVINYTLNSTTVQLFSKEWKR